MALPPPQEFTAKQQPISPNELPLVQRESRPQHDQEEPKAEREAKSWVPFHDGEIDRKPRLKSFDTLKAGEMNDVKPVLRDLTATDGLACTILEASNHTERATTLSLTTMESKNISIKCSAVDLEVMDLKEETLVELPHVFTRPHLPATVENAANQGDVDRWPHLAGIKISKSTRTWVCLLGMTPQKFFSRKK